MRCIRERRSSCNGLSPELEIIFGEMRLLNAPIRVIQCQCFAIDQTQNCAERWTALHCADAGCAIYEPDGFSQSGRGDCDGADRDGCGAFTTPAAFG